MAEIDGNLLHQMIGAPIPARAEAKPKSVSPTLGSDLPAIPAPGLKSPETNEDFLREQAVQPASEPARPAESPILVLSQEQLAAYNNGSSEDTAEAPSPLADGQVVEQPAQAPGKKFNTLGTLKNLHEQGKKLNEGKDLMSRLRDARKRIGLTVHKIAQVVGRSGEIVTTPVNSLKNLTTVLVRNPEARKEIVKVVAQDSVEAARVVAQPVINEVVTLGAEYAEELIALRNTSITINGKEYIIVDEVIDTAVAAKDGVVQTARNAHELMTATAKWIKNRVQSTQEMVSFHLNQAKAELAEIGNDRLNATGQYIDSTAGRIRGILIGKAEYLRKASVSGREKAEAVAVKSLERKAKIATLRALATPKPMSPEASGPVTSTTDQRELIAEAYLASLPLEDQLRIAQEKYRAEHPQPTPSEVPPSPNPSEQALDVNHPQHPSNTIL